MGRGLRKYLLFTILIGLLGGCGGERYACLELSSEKPARIVARLPVGCGRPFTLEFVNSIYQAPVRETLVYEPSEGITIVKVESPSDGVFEYDGFEPDGTGTARMRRRVGDIRLRSHDYKDHRLRALGRTLHLDGLVAKGDAITVKIRDGKGCGELSFSGGD